MLLTDGLSIHSYQELEAPEQKEAIMRHRELLEQAVYYYLDPNNRVFVHGGFDWHKPIDDQDPPDGEFSAYTWNRKMLITAWTWHKSRLRFPTMLIFRVSDSRSTTKFLSDILPPFNITPR